MTYGRVVVDDESYLDGDDDCVNDDDDID